MGGKQMVKFGVNNHLEIAGEYVKNLIGKQKTYRGLQNYWCKECKKNLPVGPHKGQMRREVTNHIRSAHHDIYCEIGSKVMKSPGEDLDELITESAKSLRIDNTTTCYVKSSGDHIQKREMNNKAKVHMTRALKQIFCRKKSNSCYFCKHCGKFYGKKKLVPINHFKKEHRQEFIQLQNEFQLTYDEFVNRQFDEMMKLT